MGKKERNNQTFFEKVRFKYRISVLDENTLEESWHIRLSRLSIFLYTCVFIFITFFILAVLIYVTPLRYYLPGYGDEGNRETVITTFMRADSLQHQLNRQDAYINIIRNIIAGNLDTSAIKPLDSVVIVDKKAELSLVKGERERVFVEQFEQEEKYNLASLDSPQQNNAYVFFRPVKGVIQTPFDPFTPSRGMDILTPPNENVLSVLDGTVIYADYSLLHGWVIQIQHEDNYLSVYKNNTRLLKNAGDIVHAGESIAITGRRDDKEQPFNFELWHNGNAMNPEDFIVF